MNYYDQQGKAKYVDGMGTIGEIFTRIEKVIGN